MGDSEHGAEIIEEKNFFFVKFEFSETLKNTSKIQHNWIQHIIKKVRYDGIIQLQIALNQVNRSATAKMQDEKRAQYHDKVMDILRTNLNKRDNLAFLDRFETDGMDKVKHSGQTISKKRIGRLVVENNAMNKDNIKHNFIYPTDTKMNLAFKKLFAEAHEKKLNLKEKQVQKGRIDSSVGRLYSSYHRPQSAAATFNSKLSTYNSCSRIQSGVKSIDVHSNDEESESAPFFFKNPTSSITDIRCMQHPGLSRITKMNYDHWVPGMKSKVSDIYRPTTSTPDDVVSNAPFVIKSKPNQYFYSRKNQYNIQRVEEARNVPQERRANVFMEKQTKDYLEAEASKKKFIGKEMFVNQAHALDERTSDLKNVFRRTISESDKSLYRNLYLNATSNYKPVSSHKFRDVKKIKWVSPTKDFVKF